MYIYPLISCISFLFYQNIMFVIYQKPEHPDIELTLLHLFGNLKTNKKQIF